MSYRKIGISLFSVLAAQQSFGVDWDGGGDGSNFNLGTNWVGDTFPTGGTARLTDVGHDGVGIDSLSLSADATVGNLVFNSAEDWRVFGGSGTLSVQSSISNLGSGLANLDGSISSPGSLSIVVDSGSPRIRLQNFAILSGSGDLSITGGEFLLTRNTTISGYSQVIVASGGSLNLSSGAVVGGVIDIQTGGELVMATNTTRVTSVSGVSGSDEWIFNLASNSDTSSPFVDVVGTAEIGSLTLNLSNNSSSGDVVLASYGDLVGGQFADVVGLGPGQYINYNYGPNGDQIALVPEISLASPILAAFLPLFALRRRNRRK